MPVRMWCTTAERDEYGSHLIFISCPGILLPGLVLEARSMGPSNPTHTVPLISHRGVVKVDAWERVYAPPAPSSGSRVFGHSEFSFHVAALVGGGK